MLLKIFTVYDSKAETYMQPFFSNTTGSALRSFEDTCNNPEHVFFKHAPDFTLFEIGTYDDQSSEIKMYDSKQSLGTAIEYVKQTDLENQPKLAGVN